MNLAGIRYRADLGVKKINFALGGTDRLGKRVSSMNLSTKDLLPPFSDKKIFSKEYINAVVCESEKICKHQFTILGEKISFGEKINWHLDPKSAYVWQKKHYIDLLPVFNIKDDTDAKYPYELSRFNHLPILGAAYTLTKKEEYLEEYIAQIDDWINKNPYEIGVNWSCAMDVSIRAVNWITAYHFFQEDIDEDFQQRILKNLFLHGCFIKNNLENYGVKGNHYLTDIVGLIWLGMFLKVDEWFDYGLNEFLNEMSRQVHSDGINFESSTCYHRFALELFSYTAVICKDNLPDEFLVKLEKMFDYSMNYLTPTGLNPQIGDNDNGRLLMFQPRRYLEDTYLLSWAAIMFKDRKYKHREYGLDEGVMWLFGSDGKKDI